THAPAIVVGQGTRVSTWLHFVNGARFLTGSHGKKPFVIAFRDGDLGWGHLMYSDKDSSAKLSAAKPFTSAKVYPEGRAGGGTLTGTTTAGDTFKAHITDNGEPGRDDVFDLFSPEGITLARGPLAGGNIQVHPACRAQ